MHSFNKRISNFLIFFIWFTPIFGTSLYSRFDNYQLDVSIIKVFIFSSAIVGVFTLIVRKSIKLNTNTLIAIVIIYFLALASDFSQYIVIMFFMLYAFLMHFLSINKYQLILYQYLWTCKLISLLALIDLISFFILGDVLVSWREVQSSVYIPRSQTIFDEPSHQFFYILPALIYHIKLYFMGDVKFKKMMVYMFPALITLSASAAVSLAVILIYFTVTMTTRKYLKIFTIIGVFIFYLFFIDFIFFKIYNIFNSELLGSKEVSFSSSVMYLMILDVMNSASIMDYLFGMGYFNLSGELFKYLDDIDLMHYYIDIGAFDERVNKWGDVQGGFVGNGITKLLFGYGIIALFIIGFLIHRSKENIFDGNIISTFIIFSILVTWMKAPHVIESPLMIFFLFGLYQAKGNIEIRLNTKKSP